MFASSLFLAAGSGLTSTFTKDSGLAKRICYPTLIGIGGGIGFQQPFMAVQAVLAKEDVAMGIAGITFSQTLGSAVLISVGQNVFINRLRENLAQAVPGVHQELIVNTGVTELDTVIHDPTILLLVKAAYGKSATQVYYLAAAMGCLMMLAACGVKWKSLRGTKGPATRETEEGETCTKAQT